VEVAQRRGRTNEPSLPFFFLLLPLFSPLVSSSPWHGWEEVFVNLLSLLRVCSSTYPFRPFRWNEEAARVDLIFVPFASCGCISFPAAVSFPYPAIFSSSSFFACFRFSTGVILPRRCRFLPLLIIAVICHPRYVVTPAGFRVFSQVFALFLTLSASR